MTKKVAASSNMKSNYTLLIWNIFFCTSRTNSPKLYFNYSSTLATIIICIFISTKSVQIQPLQFNYETQSTFPRLIYFSCFSCFTNLSWLSQVLPMKRLRQVLWAMLRLIYGSSLQYLFNQCSQVSLSNFDNEEMPHHMSTLPDSGPHKTLPGLQTWAEPYQLSYTRHLSKRVSILNTHTWLHLK